MNGTKLAIMAAAGIFMALAGISLYRLLFWFPISIGGAEVGQTASFFAFVIFTALSLILVRGGLAKQ